MSILLATLSTSALSGDDALGVGEGHPTSESGSSSAAIRELTSNSRKPGRTPER